MRKKYIERETVMPPAFCIGISCQECPFCDSPVHGGCKVAEFIEDIPTADVVEIPDSGIGELSDGYHTFNGLYYQRMVLFSALVNAYRDRAWKSWKHEDGEPCFGGGWFIVGIDTPKGSYTYHYEDKYWNWFECEELPTAKHWDGHTEEDVTRLLTLAADVTEVVRCWECRHRDPEDKKCDSGALERAGCVFPVDDDYFCADGERKDGGKDDGSDPEPPKEET